MAVRQYLGLGLFACILALLSATTSATSTPTLQDTPDGNFTINFKSGNISLFTELFKSPKTADEVLGGLTQYDSFSGKLVDTLEPEFRLLGWDKLSANHTYEFVIHEPAGACACANKQV